MMKIKKIRFYEEKKRFIIFSIMLLVILFVSFQLLSVSFARYETVSKLRANIDKAVYLLDDKGLTFNLDSLKLIPSDDPYVYKFSVSNFNDSTRSDISIKYKLKITTTTNLPITLALYKNENYDDSEAVNICSTYRLAQDVDGSWYKIYEIDNYVTFLYTEEATNIYSLVINFPKIYSSNTVYADKIENIEVSIISEQII